MRYMLLGKEMVNLWVANGMEMDFYADVKNLKETMGFTGSGADINNYYSAKNARAYNYVGSRSFESYVSGVFREKVGEKIKSILEADYHDRNIVFLSYSIDVDKDAWLKFVPEEELGGVQIIGEKAWQFQLCLDYKVRGVPTFLFFDTEGKIVNVKMTRPSNQKTRDTFDSYSDL